MGKYGRALLAKSLREINLSEQELSYSNFKGVTTLRLNRTLLPAVTATEEVHVSLLDFVQNRTAELFLL